MIITLKDGSTKEESPTKSSIKNKTTNIHAIVTMNPSLYPVARFCNCISSKCALALILFLTSNLVIAATKIAIPSITINTDVFSILPSSCMDLQCY